MSHPNAMPNMTLPIMSMVIELAKLMNKLPMTMIAPPTHMAFFLPIVSTKNPANKDPGMHPKNTSAAFEERKYENHNNYPQL